MAEIKLNKRYKYAGDIVKALLNRLQWTLEDATEFINSIEDADVAEVKHGKWVEAVGMAPPELHGLHLCSICKEFSLQKLHKECLSGYCPLCGAKMDLGDDEG